MTETDIILRIMLFTIIALIFVLLVGRGVRTFLWGFLSKEEQIERLQRKEREAQERKTLNKWMRDQWFK